MSGHSVDSIIRVAQAAGGPIIVGDNLSSDSVIRVVQSTTAPITVKAGSRSAESLIQIVQAGGKRVSIDFS
jgi:imidazole glycerol phosphate synthase subunit HisF